MRRGEGSMDQVSLFQGILMGKLTAEIFSTSSSTALLTAIALLAKSSRSLRLVCLLRFLGVLRLLLEPTFTSRGERAPGWHQVSLWSSSLGDGQSDPWPQGRWWPSEGLGR